MGKENKRFAGVFTYDRAAAIEQLANEVGLDFQVIARSGEGYQLRDGGRNIWGNIDDSVSRVPKGMIVGSLPMEAEYIEGFWDRVSQIQASNQSLEIES